jgi:hypothetical protein
MSVHDGAPLIAKAIHLRESEGRSQVELTNGEVIIWTGTGALAIGRQLEASIKAGRIRTIMVPSPEGKIDEVHVGPDVAILHDGGIHKNQRR